MNDKLEYWSTLLSQIDFGDWNYGLYIDDKRPYLQIKFTGPDSVTGDIKDWSGRKWFLSYHMTDSEVVQTAFLATMTAMEHETREKFKWKGEPIFRPHFDIQALHEISRANRIDKRS